MSKRSLDLMLVKLNLVETRSQAESYIKLGEVQVNGRIIKKSGYFVSENADIKLTANERYVSRAGLKLASVVQEFNLDFKNSIVLDVGSSTGGFTDFAIQHGAKKVIAVDIGTNQLHPDLRNNANIELREQTDIRDVKKLNRKPDIVTIDVSFISLHEILPHIAKIAGGAKIIAMLKPQFEIGASAKHKGIVKNERIRREIIKDFEEWVKSYFVIINKADSKIAGTKGNQERFYLLKATK